MYIQSQSIVFLSEVICPKNYSNIYGDSLCTIKSEHLILEKAKSID